MIQKSRCLFSVWFNSPQNDDDEEVNKLCTIILGLFNGSLQMGLLKCMKGRLIPYVGVKKKKKEERKSY